MNIKSSYSNFMENAAEFLGANIVRRRGMVVATFGIFSLIFFYFALQIKIEAGFDRSLPTSHPYMKVYRQYAPSFGGANTIDIAIINKNGSIFDPVFLGKVENITRQLRAIDGVNPASVLSIFSPQATYVTVDEEGFVGGRLVPATYQGTDNDVDTVKRNIALSDVVGRLVSKDLRGALIRGELVDARNMSNGTLDYRRIAASLEEIRSTFGDDSATVHVIGYAQFVSDVTKGALSVLIFFLISFIVTAVLLYRFLRSTVLCGVALLVALLSVVWQLGLTHLFGMSIDPLSILVPFLIFSIACSHAVQMANTWRQFVLEGLSPSNSAQRAFMRLFVPGSTALLGNAVGFAAIMLIDIPIIHDLGIIASVGVAVMVLTNKVLLPALLSFIHPRFTAEISTNKKDTLKDRSKPLLAQRCIASLATRRPGAWVLVALAVMFISGSIAREHLIIGDAELGVPELKADSRYNRDVQIITRNFNVGADELIVVAEVSSDDGCTDFGSLYELDRYGSYMATVEGVQNVASLPVVVRNRYVGNSEGHPKFWEIPRGTFSIGATLRGIELGERLFDSACTAIPSRIYLQNHKADTIERVIAAHNQYTGDISQGKVRYNLAAGTIGVMASVNQAVTAAQWRMLVALYCGVGALCFLTFMSLRATFCVVIPLVIVSQFAEAVMVWLGIGLKVATLPVVALGAGVGVDYGIYLFSRIQAALREGHTLPIAYMTALKQVGGAIAFTAVTMSVGVATWMFAPLKFQADMGLLLTYMFLVNMVIAFLAIPALAAFLLPGVSVSAGAAPTDRRSWSLFTLRRT